MDESFINGALEGISVAALFVLFILYARLELKWACRRWVNDMLTERGVKMFTIRDINNRLDSLESENHE